MYQSLSSHSLVRPLVCCIGILALEAEAQSLFRWNDQAGNPVFSDRAPSTRKPYVALSPATERAGIRWLQQEYSNNTRRYLQSDNTSAEHRQLSDKSHQQKTLDKACQRALEMRGAIDSGRRIFWRDQEGEKVWLDQATRDSQGAMADLIIEQAC